MHGHTEQAARSSVGGLPARNGRSAACLLPSTLEPEDPHGLRASPTEALARSPAIGRMHRTLHVEAAEHLSGSTVHTAQARDECWQ